jgi:hypothetical protein
VKVKSVILALCILILTASNGFAISSTKEIEQQPIITNKQKELFEFKFTNEELEELSKWKNKSFEDVSNDAFNCDRAALYMIGMCFLRVLF